MPDGEQTRARGAGWGRVWQVLALILALFVIEQGVEQLLYSNHRLPGAGTLGLVDQAPAAEFAPGYVVVFQVEPGTPLARVGVSAGDHLRFDRTWDYLRTPRAGETVGLTIDHGGRRVHRVLTAIPWLATPQNRAMSAYLTLYVLSYLVPALFAAFILWRSRGRKVALLLGTALACFGLSSNEIPGMWESDPRTWLIVVGFIALLGGLLFPLFVGFAMSYAEQALGRRPRWQWGLLGAYAAVCVVATGIWTWCLNFVVNLPGGGNPTVLYLLMGYPCFAATIWLLFQGWRRSDRSARNRYALMLVAFSAIVAAELTFNFAVFLKLPFVNPYFLTAWFVSGLVAPVLFAYAILRHRVMDLGFAINRTLVYAAVSAILLAAFGLIEWAVEHFVPIEGREQNALIDAAIAVGVFLTFHRVRDVVEHVVERLFFRRWQKAEAELRKFVREAAFVTQASALARAFARALADYAEGAEAAVYLADDGDYARAVGEIAGVPARLDPDLPALVSLRADPKPVEFQDDAFGAALVAPMVNRNEVIGVVLLGPKPNWLDYRPDEIELIGWATRQVGLDLHALKVEQLEADKARQAEQISVLNAKIEVFQAERQPA